ncbi:hypothetical protein Fcan01_12318 [Folsomia candida]|uniref:Uncharacterized protein n=1 Tax=Folsomia candida TaxID=158441 RepID=A0A226E867_FOLCA|nr:hypothetical protein Fcan01_12318 [Folsomia candida]
MSSTCAAAAAKHLMKIRPGNVYVCRSGTFIILRGSICPSIKEAVTVTLSISKYEVLSPTSPNIKRDSGAEGTGESLESRAFLPRWISITCSLTDVAADKSSSFEDLVVTVDLAHGVPLLKTCTNCNFVPL